MSVREERALALLQAALQVVLRHGYRKTTLEDIAQAAGVSRATVYNYFSSKEDLVRAIVARETRALLEHALAGVREEDPPEERLRSWFRGWFEQLARIREIYNLALGEVHQVIPVAQGEIQAMEAAQRDFLVRTISEGVRSGRFRPMDPEEIMLPLQAAIQGLANSYLAHEQDDVMQGAGKLLDLLILGLMNQEEGR